MDPYS
jgi:hypothetical protein